MGAVSVSRKEFYGRLKREVGENVVGQSLMLLGHSSEKSYRRLTARFNRIAGTEHQKRITGWIDNWLAGGHPGGPFICAGCYAGKCMTDDDMPPELFDRIVSQAEAIGIKSMPVLGGEPFVYLPLLDAWRKGMQAARLN